MRRAVTPEKLRAFMRELSKSAKSPGKIYFTGGATAMLLGIRKQTIDVDIKMDPEPAGAFAGIAALKNKLDLNVELASPDDFIPVHSDWRERSVPIETIGEVSFYHFDLYAQALAKIERGHQQDLADVRELIKKKLIDPSALEKYFTEIAPELLRYPAIDPAAFAKQLKDFLATL